MIIAIVLAAGESTRMSGDTGKPVLKQLLPFGKSTILESVIQAIFSSRVDKIIVVLGHQATLIRKKIKKYNLETVVNWNYKKGMLSSIQCGVSYARKLFAKTKKSIPPDAIMIFLGDQPALCPSVITKLLDRYKKSDSGICIPIYRKKRGHPVIIRSSYCDEIMNIPLEKGLHQLMSDHSYDIEEISVRSSSVLKDIDTPQEYRKAANKRLPHLPLLTKRGNKRRS